MNLAEITERTPMFDEVKLENEVVDNPFKDPAVQEATSVTIGLDISNYDPYRSTNVMSPSGDVNVSLSSADSAGAYTSIQLDSPGKIKLSITELQKKQEELERREEELTRKEEELRRSSFHMRPNNWPPLPKFCFIQPCFFQDIDLEIPVEFQPIVKKLYKIWIFHEIVMLANVFGGLFWLDPSVIGFGFLYLLLYTPFSYVCWFRPAYKAFRSDSSINFMMFFFMFFIQFIITFMQGIGMPGSGSIGVITVIKGFATSKLGFLSGLFGLLVASGFCAAAVGDFILIGTVHKMYRKTGASFAKAQQEFAANFLQSEYMRDVTSQNARARP